jgi:hypothetical protein
MRTARQIQKKTTPISTLKPCIYTVKSQRIRKVYSVYYMPSGRSRRTSKGQEERDCKRFCLALNQADLIFIHLRLIHAVFGMFTSHTLPSSPQTARFLASPTPQLGGELQRATFVTRAWGHPPCTRIRNSSQVHLGQDTNDQDFDQSASPIVYWDFNFQSLTSTGICHGPPEPKS